MQHALLRGADAKKNNAGQTFLSDQKVRGMRAGARQNGHTVKKADGAARAGIERGREMERLISQLWREAKPSAKNAQKKRRPA